MSKLGSTIKKLRIENKLTQGELAGKLDLSDSTIGMYERDERQPDASTMLKIAKYFNVSVDYLLGNDIKKIRSTEASDFDQNVMKIDDNINIVFTDQAGLDENDIEEIKRFVEFVRSKKK